jgi:hypothetical protein
MTFNDEFEQMLDDALAEYRKAEPLAGLEDRVLQRLKSQAERRRRLWWQWSAIAAATAVLAIAAWIGLSGRARHEAIPSPVVRKQDLPAEPSPRTPDALATNTHASNPVQVAKNVRPEGARVPAPGQLASAEGAPMREQFPSQVPLKAEERVLLALAQTHPEVLREWSRDGSDQEISIAPINIKPLVDETGSNQGEN